MTTLLDKLPEHVRVVYKIEKLLQEEKPDMKRISELRMIADGEELHDEETRLHERLRITKEELKKYKRSCKENDIDFDLFKRRVLYKGIEIVRASTERVLKRRPKIYIELGLTLEEWQECVKQAESIGLTRDGLRYRLRQSGMSLKEAITKPVNGKMRRNIK